jgi:hypothetical protein
MPKKSPNEVLNAPASAFCFLAPTDPIDPAAPRVLLRSNEAIDHPWWGPIVHDMAGVQAIPDKLLMDYIHDPNQVLGYGDEIGIDAAGLSFTPHLLPHDANPEDRAAEILRNSKAGTPYQASLDWRGPSSIEWVDPNVSVEVNGKTFVGPLAVVRKWSIAGAAICPRGADPNTFAQFAAKAPREHDTSRGDANPFSVPTTPAPNMPQEQNDFKQLFSKYAKAFGAERALTIVEAGTSYEAALEAELAERSKQFTTQFELQKKAHDEALAKAEADKADLTNQLAAVKKQFEGEATPLPSGEAESAADKPADNAQSFTKFQSLVKLPTKR